MYIKIIIALFALAPFMAQAQLANRSNLTFKEIQDRVNGLLASSSPLAKDSIQWEAAHLVASKNEEYISHGKSLYNFLGNTAGVETAHQKLLKEFPNSSYAATHALDHILKEYTDAESLEKAYQKWAKRYKAALKSSSFQDGVNSKVATKLLQNDEVDAANKYAEQIQSDDKKISYYLSLAQHYFDQGDFAKSYTVLDNSMTNYAAAFQKSTNLFKGANTLLAQVYAKQDRWKDCLQLIEEQKLGLSDLKFESLYKLGRYFDAYLLLDNHFSKAELTDFQNQQGALLFEKLGSTAAEWDAYKARVNSKKLKDRQDKWKSAMLDKEAIAFELTDMAGNIVKSSDYLGKIVVLDFWATWCGPCVNSFPGMQAAVNKYKDDDKVVFLFINTWERGQDYKEKVKAFIDEKGYDFKVVFDKMDGAGALVDQYGIQGIPTKIIIDEAGRVRFQSSGSSAVIKEVVDEITYKIDLIRK